MKYVFKGKETIVKAGQTFIINPFETHYNFADSKRCNYNGIFVPLHVLNQSRDYETFISLDDKVNADRNVYDQLQQFIVKIRSTKIENELTDISEEISKLILADFPRHLKKIIIDERVSLAINHIKNNLTSKLTIDIISKACSLSPFHFQRIFKLNTGLTVNEYIHLQRMDLGKRLINQGNSIAKTALETGYFDQSHFHRHFKKMWVSSPGAL